MSHPSPPNLMPGVWVVRYPDQGEQCDGDLVSLHLTQDGARAEADKFASGASGLRGMQVEFWPVLP